MCLIPIYPMCGDTAGHCGVKKDHYALLILSLENTSAPYLCEVYILMLYQHMYSFLWLTTSYSCNGRLFFTPIWSRSFFTPLYDIWNTMHSASIPMGQSDEINVWRSFRGIATLKAFISLLMWSINVSTLALSLIS